jgi:hypothetical protein
MESFTADLRHRGTKFFQEVSQHHSCIDVLSFDAVKTFENIFEAYQAPLRHQIYVVEKDTDVSAIPNFVSNEFGSNDWNVLVQDIGIDYSTIEGYLKAPVWPPAFDEVLKESDKDDTGNGEGVDLDKRAL